MSTDSDPPTDDEQVRELVRDELANALEEADIDLGDLPQEKGTTRREVLKAAGLAGAAGLTGAGGMSAATEPASAGSKSSGTVGSAANPVDVEAEDINTAAIKTETPSGATRLLVDETYYNSTTGKHEINVPGDVSTIQGACDKIPLYPMVPFEITIEDGTYDEDVEMPETISGKNWTDIASEEWTYVQLKGNNTTPGNVKIGSLAAYCHYGMVPLFVEGFQTMHDCPHVNENTPLWIGGGGSARVMDVNLRSVDGGRGMTVYNAQVSAEGTVDFGASEFGKGVDIKKQGMYQEKPGATISGSTTNYAYSVASGQCWFNDGSTLSGSSGKVDVGGSGQGYALNVDTAETYGLGPSTRAAKAYLSADQTIANVTIEKIAFDTIGFDDGGDFNTTNNEFVVPRDGKYEVSGIVTFTSDMSTAGYIRMIVQKNGTGVSDNFSHPSTTADIGTGISTVVECTSGDTLSVAAVQNTGAGATVGSANSVTHLVVKQVGY